MSLEEKEILLGEIRYYQDIVNESINLHRENEYYYSKPTLFKGFGIGRRIVLFLIVWFLLGMMGRDIYPLLGLVIFFGSIYFLFLWPTVHVKKKIRKNKDRINNIQLRLTELDRMVNPVHIPKAYINNYALSKLESYFVNKRADTLKEALNLFEEEKRHDQQMIEINIVQQLQEMTYKKADEAATLGWYNFLFKR